MALSSFAFDPVFHTLMWTWQAKTTVLYGVQQACYDEKRNLIMCLSSLNPTRQLDIFSEDGALVLQLAPPGDYQFEYLLEDATYGVRAICSATNAAGDMLDWFFEIDLSTGTLTRQGRTY